MAKFLLSKNKVLEQYRIVKEYCDEVSYSAKTNYEVARVLEAETQCSFNLHFAAEVALIKEKARVWFFPQGWDEREVNEVVRQDVTKFVVDNENDLQVLLSFLEKNPVKIDLLLRMKLKERTVQTGKYYVYGLKLAQVKRLLPALRENRQVRTLGIHFHRKSQNISEWNLLYELQQLLDEKTLAMIDVLDIGGGIPVRYKNFNAAVHERIFKEFRDLRAWLQPVNVQLIIEPGRFIAAPAIQLVTRVRNIHDDTIIVDASVYNCAIDTFVVHHKLLVAGEVERGEGTPYTLKGYTPCSADIFRYKVYLPPLQRGDEIVFLNAGAYNFSSDFCTLPKIPTEVVR